MIWFNAFLLSMLCGGGGEWLGEWIGDMGVGMSVKNNLFNGKLVLRTSCPRKLLRTDLFAC